MSGANMNDKLQLKAMVNKGKKKVLFAEADSYFVDVLLSFLTLPLGKTLKILEREYGDKAPAIGRLSKLHRSLANLDGFGMEGAKRKALLDPTSSFEAEYKRLKLDITSPPSSWGTRCYLCGRWYSGTYCGCSLNKGDDVFTLSGTSFVISDDLQIFPSETGLLEVLRMIGIADMDGAETIQVEFGMSEIVSLLKASLTSSSPLTDVILNRGNSAHVVLEPQPKGLAVPLAGEQTSPIAFGNVGLKVTVQRSTGKVLNAQPKEDFMKVLYGIFSFRLGRAELLPGGTSFKAINSLYRSAAELIDDKYFKNGMKSRLIRPDLPLDNAHTGLFMGQSSYLVMDDLTVMPFSLMSTVSAIKEQKIPISDVEEMVLQVGKKEALSIVKASLSSSTTVLTDALMSHRPNKRVKRET